MEDLIGLNINTGKRPSKLTSMGATTLTWMAHYTTYLRQFKNYSQVHRCKNVILIGLCCRRCARTAENESREVTVQFSLQVYEGQAAYPDSQSTRC